MCTEPAHVRQFQLFQTTVQTMMDVVASLQGEVRQLITDDKGTVMIVVFGTNYALLSVH